MGFRQAIITARKIRTRVTGRRVEINTNDSFNEIALFFDNPGVTQAVISTFGPDYRLVVVGPDAGAGTSALLLSTDGVETVARLEGDRVVLGSQVNDDWLTIDAAGTVRVLQDLDVDGLVSVTGETWHIVGGVGEPAFQNSWTGVGSRTPRFMKYPDGDVAVEGSFANGSAATAAVFTLPAGYRPPATFAFTATTGAGVHVRGVITAAGVLNFSHGGSLTQTDVLVRFSTL